MLAVARAQVNKIISKSKFQPEDKFVFSASTGELRPSRQADVDESGFIDGVDVSFDAYIRGRPISLNI